MRNSLLVVLLATVGCSGGRGGTTPTGPSGGAPPDAASVAEAPVPDADCEAIVAHVMELEEKERATRPPEQRPTDADQELVRTRLHPFLDECRALPREARRCALDARSTAEMSACHWTRSSSTSNNSVAPGGMTPPAPRSP